MARNFRSLFRWVTPSWLHTGEGEKVLHALTTIIDASTERVLQGLDARFPSRTGADALQLTAVSRGLIRGRSETDAHFAARLKRWRYPRGHRVRGSAFALLDQVSEYFGGVMCQTRDVNGTTHGRLANGIEYLVYDGTWLWDDTPSTQWARFWLFVDLTGIALPQPDFGDPDLWGGELGLPGHSIGYQGFTPEDANAIRRLLEWRPWKPAGARAEWLILATGPLAVAPDGAWRYWSVLVDGHQIAARYDGYRYVSLSPQSNNTYSGYPENFCIDSGMPDGSVYGGDPTSFPNNATMPDGSVYAGNPSSFPTSVLLLDDGDAPR
jgi:hypothetical protein